MNKGNQNYYTKSDLVNRPKPPNGSGCNTSYCFNKIINLIPIDSAKTLPEFFLYLQEEIGEVAQCLSTESGLKNKKLKEQTHEELVDVILCSLIMYFAAGGSEDHLNSYMIKKLKKWENRLNDR